MNEMRVFRNLILQKLIIDNRGLCALCQLGRFSVLTLSNI